MPRGPKGSDGVADLGEAWEGEGQQTRGQARRALQHVEIEVEGVAGMLGG